MYPKSQGPRGRGPEVLGILGPRPSGPWDLKYLGLKVRGPKVQGPRAQGLMALESIQGRYPERDGAVVGLGQAYYEVGIAAQLCNPQLDGRISERQMKVVSFQGMLRCPLRQTPQVE